MKITEESRKTTLENYGWKAIIEKIKNVNGTNIVITLKLNSRGRRKFEFQVDGEESLDIFIQFLQEIKEQI